MGLDDKQVQDDMGLVCMVLELAYDMVQVDELLLRTQNEIALNYMMEMENKNERRISRLYSIMTNFDS